MAGNAKFHSDRSFSNLCGVTLMNNQNGHVVADVMRTKPDVSVEEYPSMIRVDGVGKLLFDFDEITEVIGFEFDQSDFEEIMSTHYGRMVHFDDKTMLFASPEEAAEYIDFDLRPVQ
ncbi:propane 2-monooxygenase effector subunit MimD [Streptomyces lydicus]|uniref:propane 2-monooxygenase effector subunit MimD n=1 Tax=Streptomyces lydicus TaxID=47763 RepID=UPI003433C7CA